MVGWLLGLNWPIGKLIRLEGRNLPGWLGLTTWLAGTSWSVGQLVCWLILVEGRNLIGWLAGLPGGNLASWTVGVFLSWEENCLAGLANWRAGLLASSCRRREFAWLAGWPAGWPGGWLVA